uniref:LOW QUALITY PROTEIN: protein rapunzel-like n=1 Tax=Gasterosteus aculeatus aculeatus TaxID=481459 RepID=UPI001A97FC13|nr:LOW QUALITY PROTEIN: protein rapunzel-like [Gasterosteus aculeatus aculeatus]
MADAENINDTAVKVLHCLEKVSSFASSIHPIFGIVSSLVGVARKGLIKEEGHALDKEFQPLHSELETISKKNSEWLMQIRLNKVNETYVKLDGNIRDQYTIFNNMVEKVKKDLSNTQLHMAAFKTTYGEEKGDMSLDVYYKGIMGIEQLFAKPLLKAYFDSCNGDRKTMEPFHFTIIHCSHIIHLFHMVLIALMGYTAVVEDDKDEMQKKWTKRVAEIQEKMEAVLSQCKDNSS